jgi:predicted dehydrogenase
MTTKICKNAILGFGSRGVSFVKPILNNNINNQITTIIDPDISRSKYFLEQCIAGGDIPQDEANKIRFIKGIDELQKNEIDALWLTASEKVRTQLFEKAVKYGAHIYCEKGLSNNIEGAKIIVDALKFTSENQVIFMGFNLRHNPALREVKKIINEGRIGNVLFAQYLEQLRYIHGASYYMRFHRDVQNSGGMLITKACHDFDLIGHLLGSRPHRIFASEYKRLYGKGGENAREQCHTCNRTNECEWDRMRQQKNRREKRKYSKIYLDEDKVTTDGYYLDLCCWRNDTKLKDLTNVMFEYENGVPVTYSQILFAPEGNRTIKIFGDSGSLVFNEKNYSINITDRWNTKTDEIICKSTNDMHGGADTGVVEEFFSTISGDKKLSSTIEDGVWALAAAEAAYKSSKEGNWTEVRPFVNMTGINE